MIHHNRTLVNPVTILPVFLSKAELGCTWQNNTDLIFLYLQNPVAMPGNAVNFAKDTNAVKSIDTKAPIWKFNMEMGFTC